MNPKKTWISPSLYNLINDIRIELSLKEQQKIKRKKIRITMVMASEVLYNRIKKCPKKTKQ